jgi:hypothetical protein
MGLDIRYLTRGFTLIIFNTEYVDKKEFMVLNIPTLTTLMKEAIYRILGPSVYSISNPQNILHFPLPIRYFVLSQDDLACSLNEQYSRFDFINIIKGIKRVVRQASNADPDIPSYIDLPLIEEQAVKIEKRLIKDFGSKWKSALERKLHIKFTGLPRGGGRWCWNRGNYYNDIDVEEQEAEAEDQASLTISVASQTESANDACSWD